MSAPHTLFEVSWEVCNKVGGIHTVVSTKAKTLCERFGDEYVAIGPWLLSGSGPGEQFEEEQGFSEFSESCRAMGVPVRVGRWKIPGRPRTILVEFTGLFAKKDEILARMWELHKVDSLFGGWDYVEPVVFGHAAAMVIEKWWQEYCLPKRRRAVAQFHEWMVASGMFYLKHNVPSIGSVFTTHATMLGRSIASTGRPPVEGLAGRKPEEAADAHGVRSKHSLERTAAREADVFTTVSEITADEAEVFFERRAAPLLPNGIDLDVIDELAGESTRDQAQVALRELAHRFLGEDVGDATLLCISGRYEFHNKGIDVLLDGLADMNSRRGQRVVLFVLVPAGNSGIRAELMHRLKQPLDQIKSPMGLSTHNLFDFDNDPVHQRARALGLDNALGSRVKLIQIPVYFNKNDGLLNLPYEAVLRGMDLSCFPSFYEPWGYTPEESLAVGVPTVTTDCAGFGRWARDQGLGPEDGVYVLLRTDVDDKEAANRLTKLMEGFVAARRDAAELNAICRHTAQMTAWTDLVDRYYEAFEAALLQAGQRSPEIAPEYRPKVQVNVAPARESQRPRLMRFDVSATMPAELKGLEKLSRNYWWSWDAEATALFREVFPAKWDACHHNAVRFLRDVYPEDLAKCASDKRYVERLKRTVRRFDQYMALEGAEHRLPDGSGALSTLHPAAYFCAEFGVHESLRIYSGGLGILAGDHLKSASDLNVPLVGVGLFYRMGYFTQRLTPAGDQVSLDAENEPRDLPVEPILDENEKPLEISLAMPSSTVVLRAWRVRVGRVSLYLLDSNVPANRPEDREITRQLYGGDHETRLRQEIVLGRGGVRLLQRLGLEPAVFHINEGHAAFLTLERVGRLVREEGLTVDEAREMVRATTVFTTHTPVPAGHDRFGEDLMRRYFSDAPSSFGVPWERFYAFGQGEDDRGPFNMTYLALNFAAYVNGVSKLHGAVTRKLLHPFWPKLLEGEVPVHAITNGVHLATWVDPEIKSLFGVEDRPIVGADFEKKALSVDGAKLWNVRQRAKQRLADHLADVLKQSFIQRDDSPLVLGRTLDGLNKDALWIGFARRFAPYKRAQLLFKDRARLAALLSDHEKPVRIVFAGKAHPNDKLGQEILKTVVEATRSDDLVGKIFFVEDYDIELAHHLVRGVDLWLNNPIRPLEASGTSGMKVAANAGLNLSVLDGWWVEAYDEKNGWAFGGGRVYQNQALQDELDADNLYRLLEEDVVPLYYDRDERADDGASAYSAYSNGWLERVRANLATVPSTFNTDRMVAQYRDEAYLPLASQYFALSADEFRDARSLSQRHAQLRRGFADVKIVGAKVADLVGLQVGNVVDVRVEVDLASLTPEDVIVELVLGHTDGNGDLHNRITIALDPAGDARASVHAFEGSHRMQRSGSFGYGIRVCARPAHEHDLALMDLVLWV